jgi:hypothetical protein
MVLWLKCDSRENYLTGVKVEHLTAEEIGGFDKTCQDWLDLAQSTDRVYRIEAEDAIKALYKLLKKPAPVIFWCQSPWQMWMMPAVMQLMMRRDDLWEHKAALTDRAEPGLWQSLLTEICAQFSFRHYAYFKSYGARRQKDFSPEFEDLYKSIARPDSTNSFSALSASPEPKFRGLLNSCFDKDNAPVIRNRFDSQFRSRLNITAGSRMAGELIGMSIPTAELLLGQPLEFPLQDASLFAQLFAQDLFELLNTDIEHFEHLDSLGRVVNWWWGPWSSVWLAVEEFALQYPDCQAPELAADLAVWCRLARSATAFAFCREVCFVCERPTQIHFDHASRLHSENGPAIKFSDGFELHSWSGVTISKQVAETPEELMFAAIQAETNAEVRRVMIERYGVARFISRASAQIIESDRFGTLYRYYMNDDEHLVMVKVTNGTPQSDGTFKEYFLRVPPEITTARAAVAWTFGMESDEYNPEIET